MTWFNFQPKLNHRKDQGLYRSRHTLASPQTPEIWCEGKKYLAFCSNNYLGLANHPDIVSAFQQGANRFGVGGGASHLIIGHSTPHHQLEEELAAFTGRERTLLFANGYMANLGVISALLGKSDAIFLDRLNHASLLDAGKLSGARFHRYRHSCCEHLKDRLKKSHTKRKLVVTDGVFSMDGHVALLPQLADISYKHDAWLMVDDAHGFGFLGKNGGGSAEHFGLSQQKVPVLMGTLSKAFGVYGAFVAGSHELIETLIQFARTYIYTTSIPPAIAEASRVSLKLVQRENWRREHLNDLIHYFCQGCDALNIQRIQSTTPIHPIPVGSAKVATKISHALAESGILVTAIRPPTVPPNTSRLRISLTAAHTRNHVDRLLSALKQATQQHLCEEG
ncbi:MAG: 8-amino-7-oxononanoate synthase [Endozoicomonas sp. (ex Botrylloides leachii)]|nr:8-amino-7-oxononanoate synthase [Endozoicomonas sp. (ex Botrylloides leachii)]